MVSSFAVCDCGQGYLALDAIAELEDACPACILDRAREQVHVVDWIQCDSVLTAVESVPLITDTPQRILHFLIWHVERAYGDGSHLHDVEVDTGGPVKPGVGKPPRLRASDFQTKGYDSPDGIWGPLSDRRVWLAQWNWWLVDTTTLCIGEGPHGCEDEDWGERLSA